MHTITAISESVKVCKLKAKIKVTTRRSISHRTNIKISNKKIISKAKYKYKKL
jgi:hypothetical protein